MAKLTGGQAFEQRMTEIAKNVKKAARVRVGVMSEARYPDGTSVGMVAAIQEFGSARIPPRPFMRRMIADKSPEWPDAIAKLLEANNFDAAKTLDIAGVAIAGQLQQSIRDLTDPPLAPSTIAKKGFSKPLVETGLLLASVKHEVDQ